MQGLWGNDQRSVWGIHIPGIFSLWTIGSRLELLWVSQPSNSLPACLEKKHVHNVFFSSKSLCRTMNSFTIDALFPLVGWWIEGLETSQQQVMMRTMIYQSPAPLPFDLQPIRWIDSWLPWQGRSDSPCKASRSRRPDASDTWTAWPGAHELAARGTAVPTTFGSLAGKDWCCFGETPEIFWWYMIIHHYQYYYFMLYHIYILFIVLRIVYIYVMYIYNYIYIYTYILHSTKGFGVLMRFIACPSASCLLNKEMSFNFQRDEISARFGRVLPHWNRARPWPVIWTGYTGWVLPQARGILPTIYTCCSLFFFCENACFTGFMFCWETQTDDQMEREREREQM